MATELMPVADHPADDAAFESEALPCIDDVYRFAMSLTCGHADAEDLVQETYVWAYRSWYTFEPSSDVRRWLYTICHALWRTREPADPPVPVADDDGERPLTPAALTPVLSHALDRLPEPYRSVVMLVLVHGMSYAAASAILDVPIETLRTRLFSGRRLLQRLLADLCA